MSHRHTWKGRPMFLVDIAREAGVSYNTLRHRVSAKGWTVERAIAEPTLPNRGRSKMVEFRGETLSVAQWAARMGITLTSMRSRLLSWPIEEALGTVGRRPLTSNPGNHERDQPEGTGCPRCGLHGEHECLPDSATYYVQFRRDNGDATIGRRDRA